MAWNGKFLLEYIKNSSTLWIIRIIQPLWNVTYKRTNKCSLNTCHDVLKIVNLQHKWGCVDSQLSSIVYGRYFSKMPFLHYLGSSDYMLNQTTSLQMGFSIVWFKLYGPRKMYFKTFTKDIHIWKYIWLTVMFRCPNKFFSTSLTEVFFSVSNKKEFVTKNTNANYQKAAYKYPKC